MVLPLEPKTWVSQLAPELVSEVAALVVRVPAESEPPK